MEIYGIGIIALCMFLGSVVGRILGAILGTGDDIGGVGFAMLFLMLFCNHMQKNKKELSAPTERGIRFLSAIYIPVVVAMSAKQNVVTAVSGGAIAILAGVIATVAALAMVPIISKLGNKKTTKEL